VGIIKRGLWRGRNGNLVHWGQSRKVMEGKKAKNSLGEEYWVIHGSRGDGVPGRSMKKKGREGGGKRKKKDMFFKGGFGGGRERPSRRKSYRCVYNKREKEGGGGLLGFSEDYARIISGKNSGIRGGRREI